MLNYIDLREKAKMKQLHWNLRFFIKLQLRIRQA